MEAQETFACARAAEFSRPLGAVKSIAWPLGIRATLGRPPAATGFGKRTPVLTAEGCHGGSMVGIANLERSVSITTYRNRDKHVRSVEWDPGAYSIGTDAGLTGMGNSASTRFAIHSANHASRIRARSRQFGQMGE